MIMLFATNPLCVCDLHWLMRHSKTGMFMKVKMPARVTSFRRLTYAMGQRDFFSS